MDFTQSESLLPTYNLQSCNNPVLDNRDIFLSQILHKESCFSESRTLGEPLTLAWLHPVHYTQNLKTSTMIHGVRVGHAYISIVIRLK